MNAYEIIKEIISDGILQSKVSIWERMKFPDYDIPKPIILNEIYSTAEEWLLDELKKLALENYFFEKEFYASKPLMNEAEYINANLSYYYKIYVPDYYEYKKKWEVDSNKLKEIENWRNEVIAFLNNDLLNLNIDFSSTVKDDIISIYHSQLGYSSDFYKLEKTEKLRISYSQIWEKARTVEGRINVLMKFEEKWFYFFNGYDYKYFDLEAIVSVREKAQVLKLNYINEWKTLIEQQKFDVNEWEQKKLNHIQKQKNRLIEIEELRVKYNNRRIESIIELCKWTLKLSSYQFNFNIDVKVDYKTENKILIVDYSLPNIDQIPNVKEVKYVKSRNCYENIEVPQKDLLKLFDDTCYSVTLRSIYELFSVDTLNTIDAICFNGWINSVNIATGKKQSTCIISIQVSRQDFIDIELNNVDVKACFKHFRGVGSSKLSGITAIQPIMQIRTDDKRFVAAQSVEFDNSTNLAAMDWEDFEHLIREIFEKEFSSNGGEVKVTQASRDGGVDAIAFDPDPIRGGKIVIQAKRYTNTVGVSAVRDLFGTVMNEGANKGILVTTSDYGPDSYEFAKGKPLTLLNGSNLLYLLEKHGHKAKIDIQEARRIFNS